MVVWLVFYLGLVFYVLFYLFFVLKSWKIDLWSKVKVGKEKIVLKFNYLKINCYGRRN